ncbi:hypothetical protein [Kaistella palustris]|uniref:hypothetical protein n=1 Tax=Kaistella palustris TaxID=493376 RepID=UPI00041A5794|nr:hypothetical protein [Kaistella palustris]
MKKIILILLANLAYGQISIGKTTVSGSGILDFATGTTKGIILPNVTKSSTMTNVTPGTIVFDLDTSKVLYNDGFWKELTDKPGIAPTLLAGTDYNNAKVVFGDQTTTADGALVLEAPDKALILPQITNPVANVKSPVAGMMCYDPSAKLMCIYNGKEWFFWK